MAELRWDLEKVLEARGITRYELAQNMEGNFKTRLTSLYRTKDPKRVDLPVMAEIVSALRRITGEALTPNDLLEYVPDPEPVEEQEMDAETRAWMEADLAPPLEPYEWGPEGPPKGNPVRYVAGQGWMVYEDEMV